VVEHFNIRKDNIFMDTAQSGSVTTPNEPAKEEVKAAEKPTAPTPPATETK
jgi:hypothetical protein